MKFKVAPFLDPLPLPATKGWPEGVRDIEAFRHGSMSLLLFAPKGKDHQTPHGQDELYFVVRGSGEFEVRGETTQFRAGDALFVPAGAPHRFTTFSEDLVTWAVFYGPKGGEEHQSPSTNEERP